MTRSDSETLDEFVKGHPNRPLLTHLNADTSWLISFPRPLVRPSDSTRMYYHLLVDPWLTGHNIVGYAWIMSLTHAIAPAFASIQEVRELIMKIEWASGISDPRDDGEPDCVCVTHSAPDHCHKDTLAQLHPSTPVISTTPGLAQIKAFKHFDNATFSTIPDLKLESPEELWMDPSITSSYNPTIPSWLKIGQLPSHGGYPYLHWATLIVWKPPYVPLATPESAPEIIIYTPHGIRSERLQDTSWATDPTKGSLLCSMHGLAPAWSPQLVNMGVQNGYELSKLLKPKYWIPTHDEELTYTGFIGWMQTKVQKTLQDVIRSNEDTTVDEELKGAGTTMRELGNGETFCLV